MMRHRILWAMLPALLLFSLALPPQSVGGDKKDEEKKYNLIYVPTEERVIEKMFEMAKVKKGDVVFDLGCGDGRIVAMAAKKFGTRGVGIDLNPERIRECMDTIARGEPYTRLHNLAGKRNACYAAQLAMQAVSRLFNAAGGRALYNDSVLQRQFRDCYAASAHHSLVWETAAQAYGAHALEQAKSGNEE